MAPSPTMIIELEEHHLLAAWCALQHSSRVYFGQMEEADLQCAANAAAGDHVEAYNQNVFSNTAEYQWRDARESANKLAEAIEKFRRCGANK